MSKDFSTSSNASSPITIDDILKMQAKLAEIGPMPRIDSILFTDTGLIPEGAVFKAEHEEKTYLLMQKKDVDEMIEDATLLTPKHVRYDMNYPLPPGALGMIAGIPIYEDTKMIEKILFSQIEALWKHRMFSRPFINPYSPISRTPPSS